MKKLIVALSLIVLLCSMLLVSCFPDEAGYIRADPSEFFNIGLATGNTTYQVPRMDSATWSIVTIEYEHFQIHEGTYYTVLEVTDLGNGAVRDIIVVTPDTTEWAHLVWEIEHELETSIQFYRDTLYSDNGTAIQSFNRNGNSTNNSTTLVYHTPTITNVGTLIATIQQGDGKKAGGSDRLSNEFILKQNTAYLIRITNLTVNNNLIFMKLNWYEQVNRDP